MNNPLRDLIVMLRSESPIEIEQEMECLHEILDDAETGIAFYKATELVDRNKIVTNAQKLRKVIDTRGELKPFRFLLNKN